MTRIHRHIIEKRYKLSDEPDLVDDDDTPVPVFVEGLSSLLCGFSARLNASVLAAPMAHFIVTNDSCFMSSHTNGILLLPQLEDCINDEQKKN